MRTPLFGRNRDVVELCLVLIPAVFATCASATLPPEPSNAALLYYQAMLCAHEPNRAMQDLIGETMAWGAQPPGEQIREYVEDWRTAIRFVEGAAKIADCDWGRWYSGVVDAYGLLLLSHVGDLAEVLCLDARILAVDGKYRESLERCLTIHALAKHIGNETNYFYSRSMRVDEWAQRYMTEALGLMPPDPNTVTWLMDQLATMRPVSRSPARALEMNFELAYFAIKANEGTLAMVRNEPAKASENSLAALTNDELCAHIRKPYEEYVASALQVLAREPPYYEEPEATAEFQKLTDDLQKKVEKNPAARAVHVGMTIWVEQTLGLYGSQAWHTARFNAFHAALDVYRLRARDGHLPETLPDGLPTDPFSGRSFDYQITPEGFQLRCRVKDFVPRLHLNEFPVAKHGAPGDGVLPSTSH